MDYMKFIEHHRATDADITIGVLPVDRSKASEFGVMKINDEGQIQVGSGQAAQGRSLGQSPQICIFKQLSR